MEDSLKSQKQKKAKRSKNKRIRLQRAATEAFRNESIYEMQLFNDKSAEVINSDVTGENDLSKEELVRKLNEALFAKDLSQKQLNQVCKEKTQEEVELQDLVAIRNQWEDNIANLQRDQHMDSELESKAHTDFTQQVSIHDESKEREIIELQTELEKAEVELDLVMSHNKMFSTTFSDLKETKVNISFERIKAAIVLTIALTCFFLNFRQEIINDLF